jgi:hypothetical protein
MPYIRKIIVSDNVPYAGVPFTVEIYSESNTVTPISIALFRDSTLIETYSRTLSLSTGVNEYIGGYMNFPAGNYTICASMGNVLITDPSKAEKCASFTLAEDITPQPCILTDFTYEIEPSKTLTDFAIVIQTKPPCETNIQVMYQGQLIATDKTTILGMGKVLLSGEYRGKTLEVIVGNLIKTITPEPAKVSVSLSAPDSISGVAFVPIQLQIGATNTGNVSVPGYFRIKHNPLKVSVSPNRLDDIMLEPKQSASLQSEVEIQDADIVSDVVTAQFTYIDPITNESVTLEKDITVINQKPGVIPGYEERKPPNYTPYLIGAGAIIGLALAATKRGGD